MRHSTFLVFVSSLLLSGAAFAQYFPQSVASGDPSSDGVVLWTRVVDANAVDADLSVDLEISTDAGFAKTARTIQLTAAAADDHVVKVWVGDLAPYTTYWYRFSYVSGGMQQYSPVGRTKTAPTADMNETVRFAVVNCQDYLGKYFNGYAKLIDDFGDDLDFVVMVGDYIYETTGDPLFQNPNPGREIIFDDQEGAIQLGSGADGYTAAGSLDNYRQLYRTYRMDPMLQKAHELFPFVTIWDDHEFSNDHWGANAVYTAGREDEYSPDRKRYAERAWMEYIPSAVGLGDGGSLAIDDSMLWPNTAPIYRDVRWGQNLHLALTDSRTYRPDHIVPEDAYPGHIGVDRATIEAVLGPEAYAALAPSLDPYVNVDAVAGVNQILRQTIGIITAQLVLAERPNLGFSEAVSIGLAAAHGNISVTWIDALFAGAGLASPFTDAQKASFNRGVSFLYMGKQQLYAGTGSRFFQVKDSFELYAAVRALQTQGAAQNLYGDAQLGWLTTSLATSNATWKGLVSSISFTPKYLDFTNPSIAPFLPEGTPDILRNRFMVGTDDWDGFPQAREQVLGFLSQLGDPVILSGDIHSSFLTDHGNGVVEVTTPAMSSETLREIFENLAHSDPQFAGLGPLLDQIFPLFGLIIQVSSLDDAVTTSDIQFSNTDNYGYTVHLVDDEDWSVGYYLTNLDGVTTSLYDATPEQRDAAFSLIAAEIEMGP